MLLLLLMLWFYIDFRTSIVVHTSISLIDSLTTNFTLIVVVVVVVVVL
jgi:hypothetical protein